MITFWNEVYENTSHDKNKACICRQVSISEEESEKES